VVHGVKNRQLLSARRQAETVAWGGSPDPVQLRARRARKVCLRTRRRRDIEGVLAFALRIEQGDRPDQRLAPAASHSSRQVPSNPPRCWTPVRPGPAAVFQSASLTCATVPTARQALQVRFRHRRAWFSARSAGRPGRAVGEFAADLLGEERRGGDHDSRVPFQGQKVAPRRTLVDVALHLDFPYGVCSTSVAGLGAPDLGADPDRPAVGVEMAQRLPARQAARAFRAS